MRWRIYRDFVRNTKSFRAPTAVERTALADLAETLRGMDASATAEVIQTAVYEVGKRHPFATLKEWFGCLYQVLLGQAEGPAVWGVRGAVWGERDGGADRYSVDGAGGLIRKSSLLLSFKEEESSFLKKRSKRLLRVI